MAVTRSAPAQDNERIDIIDLVRGFTLGGILFANMLWFSGFLEISQRDRQALLSGFGDETSLFLIRWLVHAKFYHLFAFLFGVGFALQMERSRPGFVAQFARRLGILFAFGTLHALLWWGDIVRYYAVLGFVLLMLRHLSQRQLLIGAALLSVLPLLMDLYYRQFGEPEFQFVTLTARRWLSFVEHATPWQLFVLNLQQAGDQMLSNVLHGRIFKILAMFLLGMVIGRCHVFQQPERHAAIIGRLLWPSLLIGGLGNALSVSFYYEKWGLSLATITLLRDAIGMIAVPALSLFYVCVLLWIGMPQRQHRAPYQWLRHLIPAGRMPLTNYMMQSVIAIAIFHPHLGGLYGRLGVAQCALVALLIFGVQVLLSNAWLRRYRFGPVEWLWRSGTRRRWEPLRRT